LEERRLCKAEVAGSSPAGSIHVTDHERLIRQAVGAFNEQDIEGWVGALDPHVEIEFFGGFDGVLGARFEGEEGARRFFEDWFAAFETMHVELEEFREAGEQLLILHELVGTGKESGAPVQLPGAAIYGFKGERISRAAFYYDRDEALEAARLPG
jgi:ketosteroid isomerase-like protein